MPHENRKMRVRLTSHHAIYIHNDLSNAAFYFKNRIVKRIEDGDRDGVFHEMIAGLTMTAFAMEAAINFVGDKVFGEAWDERQSYWDKLKKVLATLQIHSDFEQRPFSSVAKMQELRNALAHGKPEQIIADEIVVGFYDELEGRQRFMGGWEEMVTKGNVEDWFVDMNEIWKAMIDASGIEVYDTTSRGNRGMEFIEYVDE